MADTYWYLAGPMQGIAEYNFPAFRGAVADLRAQGFRIVSPAEMDELDGIKTDGMAGDDLPDTELFGLLRRDIQVVAADECEGVIVLDGWDDSAGARGEVHVARFLGKPVRSYPSLFPIFSGKHRERPESCPDIPRVPYPPKRGGVDDNLAALDPKGSVRTFDSGATRDTDEGKPDYEGYLSPRVIERFGEYMLSHSEQSDGTRRPSDNWQKGIPLDAYMKSAWRHFHEWWTLHREGYPLLADEALCALLFNVQGYLFEVLKLSGAQSPPGPSESRT